MYDQKVKLRIRDILPELHSNFLYASLILGFVIMVILCLPKMQFFLPRTALWNWVTKYPLDAGLIQLFSVLLLVWVVYKYLFKISAKRPFSVIFSLLFVFLIMAAEIAMENWLLKPSLRYNRPLDSLGEGFFTSLLKALLVRGGEEGTSAPSGFAMRQMFMILPFLLLSQQKKWNDVFSTKATFLLYFFNISFLISIPLLRIYRGRHTLFDVGISVGVGTFIFWLVAIIIYSLAKERRKDYLEEFTGFSLIYLFSIFFYCHRATYWLLFCFLAVLFLGVIYFLPQKSQQISTKKTAE